jgi:hypothetical protein
MRTPPEGRFAVENPGLSDARPRPHPACQPQAQRVLAEWAGQLAAEARRQHLCWRLGLLSVEEQDALFDEVALWRQTIIALAAKREQER